MSNFYSFMGTVGDGSGLRALNVNGSGTPVLFKLTAAATVWTHIHRVIFYVKSARNQFGSDTFGNLPPLANGCLFARYNSDNSVETDYLDGIPIKTNGGFSQFSYDTKILDYGIGDFVAVTKWTLAKAGKPITLSPGEYIGCTVQDDLTGLSDFCVNLQGNIVNQL